MSSRGTALIAIGMLVLGLLLGAAGGGATGFYLGQNTRLSLLGRNTTPLQRVPNSSQTNPYTQIVPRGALPPSQTISAGARVIDVEDNGPAAKAGLLAGDLISSVDNTKIDDNHSLADLIQTHKPGDKITLVVIRGSQNVTLNVVLGTAPQDNTSAYLGIRFAPAFGAGRHFQGPSNLPGN